MCVCVSVSEGLLFPKLLPWPSTCLQNTRVSWWENTPDTHTHSGVECLHADIYYMVPFIMVQHFVHSHYISYGTVKSGVPVYQLAPMFRKTQVLKSWIKQFHQPR